VVKDEPGSGFMSGSVVNHGRGCTRNEADENAKRIVARMKETGIAAW
jgi:hypothetical protein